MKRILVLSVNGLTNIKDNSIYGSLFNELSKENKIDIISLNETNDKIVKCNRNATIYSVRSTFANKTNLIKKALNLLTLNRKYKKTIKNNLSNNKYDLILYSTPPITLNSTIKYAKKRFGAKSYLLLKDIFPQNAVDLNMFSKKGLIYKYFRNKEKNLYKLSDYIGTMSSGNKDYVINYNNVNKDKVELNPNSMKIKEIVKDEKKIRGKILTKYNLPEDKTMFIYGGNLGVPQGMNYILKVIKENEKLNNQIIIVGDGTEKLKLVNFLEVEQIKNTTYINKLPRDDYNDLLSITDVGLIFLDNRFTIPNIPSRLLSYLEYSKPVIAATDVNTDLKEIIEDGNFGYWCESENPNDMLDLFEKIKENDNIKVFGDNGRKYLEENYDVKISAKLILDKLKDV